MAKALRASEEEITSFLQKIKQKLLNAKSFDQPNITMDFTRDDRKANIYFTEDAWNKVTALVNEFGTEVQWHGCVDRLSENEFEIYDIVVPPHVVTGATVTSDFEKYTEWLNNLDDDVFEHLHFHGHSHVNMGCSPSGTDMKYRHDVVTQLPTPKSEADDSFYIFLIFNKKGEWTGEVYDIKNNALYTTNEISIDVYSGQDGLLSDFIREAKAMAVEAAPMVENQYWKYSAAQKDSSKQKKPSYDYYKNGAPFWYDEDEEWEVWERERGNNYGLVEEL